MPDPIKVAFICTGNSCRSQMGEALLRQAGGDRFVAQSAGTDPAFMIHPLASETMAKMGVPMEGQSSKGWNALEADPPDIVLTVCDHAGLQPCPIFAGKMGTARWSLPDPSHLDAPDAAKFAFAKHVAMKLKAAIDELIALPLDTMTTEQINAALAAMAPDASDFQLS